MNNNTAHLIALYGSGPRQKLEIARTKLQRIQTDASAKPLDVVRESRNLQREIEQLELELNPETLPPAA